jgi:hypothetical protein
MAIGDESWLKHAIDEVQLGLCRCPPRAPDIRPARVRLPAAATTVHAGKERDRVSGACLCKVDEAFAQGLRAVKKAAGNHARDDYTCSPGAVPCSGVHQNRCRPAGRFPAAHHSAFRVFFTVDLSLHSCCCGIGTCVSLNNAW